MNRISNILLVVCSLTSLSTALSKRAVRLFDHAYSQLDARGLDTRDGSAPHAYTLPGASEAIPVLWETSPSVNMTNETAQFFPQYNSIRTKVRYGPFHMDAMDHHDGMVDYIEIGAKMPCQDCTVTFVQASLEYENGTYANANTSAWLHHCVLINLAKPDTVCGSNFYGRGQRWFASGNERTRGSWSLDGHIPAGYYIGERDIMVFETELMNQAMYNQTVMVSLTYEWIPGAPSEFYSVVPVWMDIGGCNIASDMPVKTKPNYSEETVFSYTAPTYVSRIEGAFLGMGAHLHDGGVNVEIYQDLRNQICNSVATYGGTPGYIDPPGTSMTMPMNPMFSPMEHISSMSFCYAPTLFPLIQNGSLMSITANYNLSDHMPMLTLDGDYDDIMGIAIIYVAENMTLATVEQYMGNYSLPLAITPDGTGMGGMSMMHSAGDDDDDSDSMGGGMMMGGMTCVPMRDSPGTITMTNLNTSDPDTMNALLSAIMCDSCLQVWSAPYARYLWYGVVVVIGLFAITRVATWQSHLARKHTASRIRPDIYGIPASITSVAPKLARAVRAISYRQFTPIGKSSLIRIPPLGIVLMVLCYFAFVIALQFTHASTGDLQTYQFLSVRAGWLSVSQLPLIVLLSTKRNFVTLFTAVTYERLNVMHRWISRALLMTALMHLGFQWHGWHKAGVVQYELADECIPTGAAALAMVLWMNLSSLPPFRNLAYEVWVVQHLITFFGTIIAVAYHVPDTAPYALTYVYIAAALYLTSKLYQGMVLALQQPWRSRAIVSTISESVTRVTVSPSPFRNWKAGAFARLTIPKLGLIQSHPFTIASTPTSSSGDVVFYLLGRKGFTRNVSRAEKQSHEYSVILDGPYGGSQHDLAAFSTSVLIAGGVGITYVLALLLDIAQRSACIRLPIHRLVLVWSTRDESLVHGLKSEILSSIEALLVAGVDVRVYIHVTGGRAIRPLFERSPASDDTIEKIDSNRTPSETDSSKQDSDGANSEKQPIRPAIRSVSNASSSEGAVNSISMLGERADLSSILTDARATCEGEMGVAVCGPLSMSKVVRNKVAKMQFGAASGGAGTYLHVEGFNW